MNIYKIRGVVEFNLSDGYIHKEEKTSLYAGYDARNAKEKMERRCLAWAFSGSAPKFKIDVTCVEFYAEECHRVLEDVSID